MEEKEKKEEKGKKKGKKGKKGKRGGKREQQEGIVEKQEGKYPYFASLFNIGPYDHQKSPQQIGKNSKNFQGEGNFLVAIIYTPKQLSIPPPFCWGVFT